MFQRVKIKVINLDLIFEVKEDRSIRVKVRFPICQPVFDADVVNIFIVREQIVVIVLVL